MKRLLLLASIAFLSVAQANAQCTPDPQYTEPGIYPDSATGFSAGCVGQAYTQLITNVVPVDTCVVIIPPFPCTTLAFDSIVITNFTGLPASLSYECVTSLGGCSFAGGQTGCAIITGTPVLADIGTHNLVITVDVYVGGLGTPSSTQDIDWYFIEISNCGVGLEEGELAETSLFPNPAENMIQLTNVHSDILTITDVNGQVMQVVDMKGAKEIEISIAELASGVYFVRMGDENIRFVKK